MASSLAGPNTLISMRYLAVLLVLVVHATVAQTPPDTLDFSEVSAQLIGGIETLQRGIEYPAADRDAGTEGRVIVRFVVQKDGVPTAIEVVRSVSPGLDSASVAAVRAARFVPGTQGGTPVNVRQTLPVSFRITEEPADDAFDGDALLARLGEPWTPGLAAAADSGAVAGGAGRLAWRAASGETIEAVVAGDTLRSVVLAFGPADTSMDGLRTRLADARVAVQPDGFYLAESLAANGLPARFDLRPDGRHLVMRRATCHAVPGYGCVRDFPTLIGGTQGLLDRVMRLNLPRGGRGRFDVTLVVQPDGSVSDLRLLPPPGVDDRTTRALGDAALRAARASRFVPATRGGEPVAAPTVLTFTFR